VWEISLVQSGLRYCLGRESQSKPVARPQDRLGGTVMRVLFTSGSTEQFGPGLTAEGLAEVMAV
jgi:hypothetical protein